MCLNPDGSLSDSTDYPKYQGLYLGASPERFARISSRRQHPHLRPGAVRLLLGRHPGERGQRLCTGRNRSRCSDQQHARVRQLGPAPDPVTGTIRPKIVRSIPVRRSHTLWQPPRSEHHDSLQYISRQCRVSDPSDRVGFDCFSQQDPDHVVANIEMSATVAMIVGPNVTSTWQLEWEAPVLDRVAGGSIESDGSLNDPDVDFLSADVRLATFSKF